MTKRTPIKSGSRKTSQKSEAARDLTAAGLKDLLPFLPSSLDSDFGPSGSSETRTLFLVGDVTETSCQQVMQDIFRLAEMDNKRPIYLVINTCGGFMHDAFALYDTMRISPAPVRTIGLGKIMSSGCLILAAGERGHRRMGKNAVLMYHAGRDFHSGDVFEKKNELKEFTRIENQFDGLIAKETKRSVDQVRRLYKDRLNRYMTPAQALKFGFIDLVV